MGVEEAGVGEGGVPLVEAAKGEPEIGASGERVVARDQRSGKWLGERGRFGGRGDVVEALGETEHAGAGTSGEGG